MDIKFLKGRGENSKMLKRIGVIVLSFFALIGMCNVGQLLSPIPSYAADYPTVPTLLVEGQKIITENGENHRFNAQLPAAKYRIEIWGQNGYDAVTGRAPTDSGGHQVGAIGGAAGKITADVILTQGEYLCFDVVEGGMNGTASQWNATSGGKGGSSIAVLLNSTSKNSMILGASGGGGAQGNSGWGSQYSSDSRYEGSFAQSNGQDAGLVLIQKLGGNTSTSGSGSLPFFGSGAGGSGGDSHYYSGSGTQRAYGTPGMPGMPSSITNDGKGLAGANFADLEYVHNIQSSSEYNSLGETKSIITLVEDLSQDVQTIVTKEIEVPLSTSLEEVKQLLGNTVQVATDKGQIITTAVDEWESVNYSGEISLSYDFYADLATPLPSGLVNAANLKAHAIVTVKAPAENESLFSIAQGIQQLVETIAKSNEQVPLINVITNKSFDVWLTEYPTIASGSTGSVEVINDDLTDGVINVRGKIGTDGYHKIHINGKVFLFNAVNTPESSNVTLVFD